MVQSLLDPVQLFLDHPGIAGGPLIGYQFLEGGDLLGRQVALSRFFKTAHRRVWGVPSHGALSCGPRPAP